MSVAESPSSGMGGGGGGGVYGHQAVLLGMQCATNTTSSFIVYQCFSNNLQ